MECQATHSWTFSMLVGAFLDLAITYLLLCGSTLAYFASKFLGFFGLCLPCPCDGLFGNPNHDYCMQKFLVDCPTEKISSVQFSVKNKFPFDSIWTREQNCQLNIKSVRERGYNDGREVDGEASCSSVSDARKSQDLLERELVRKDESVGLGVMNSPTSREGRFDLKGKGVGNQKPRVGIRRRHSHKSTLDYSKLSSVGSYDPMQSNVQGVPSFFSGSNKDVGEESFSLTSDGYNDGAVAPTDINFHESAPNGLSLNVHVNENIPINGDASIVEEFKNGSVEDLRCNDNEKNVISFLEQALEEEHAASATLYLELEKERSAAASAADEAMAMILRLQEEKASIEMEARQYQRIIEEKSAYDEEEMNLLKEILVRREREKHFLLKEVEVYRQMYSASEQLDGEMCDLADQQGQAFSSSSYMSEDPVLMLQQISESIMTKENGKSSNGSLEYDIKSVESKNRILAFGEELPIFKWGEDADLLNQGGSQRHPSCDEEFQEKWMVSMGEKPLAQQIEVQRLEACSQSNKSITLGVNGLGKNIIPVAKDLEQSDISNLSLVVSSDETKNHLETEINITNDREYTEKHEEDADQRSGDPCSSMHDTELHVLDVHVIDDESKLSNEVNKNLSEQLLMDSTMNACSKHVLSSESSGIQKIFDSGDCPTANRLDNQDIKNSLEMRGGLPPMGNSRGKALLADMRRYSMSAVDYERLKIDTEVEWLRERLRNVQEGREKLNFSVELEHREREKIQLQLLEDITSQLREIRHLTGPGNAARQVSLPLPSSKVMSKKRRYRSASLGVHHST